MPASFDKLVGAAEAAPIDGWDFRWLEGRATEERPSWHYSERVAARAAQATRMLDVQSGGGELLAGLPRLPPLLVAAEGYAPNVIVADGRLRPSGGCVVHCNANDATIPFADSTFDLVTSRHPVETPWREIARVIEPGGTYLSQQVGPHTVRELREFMLARSSSGSSLSKRDPDLARRAAEGAGLRVTELRAERLHTAFFDVGAVVYFLRLVVWTVPDFTVERYQNRLRALHEVIERDGSFVTSASRFLIEAHKDA